MEHSKPEIDIENASLEDYNDVIPVKINRELWLRLLHTNVISEIEANCSYENAKNVENPDQLQELNKPLTGKYMSGVLFARYLLFLKKHMKRSFNQIWSFKGSCLHDLKAGTGEIIVAENWNAINAELDVSCILW